MGFIQPSYLWLMGLLSLVFLLHLWRQRKPLLAVSALWLWDETEAPSEAARRPRRPRLKGLLWPFLALICLILALAQPYLIYHARQPGQIIVILDASASMQTLEGKDSRFELARERIARIVKEQPEGTRFMLIKAGSTPKLSQPFTADREIFQKELRRITADDTQANSLSAVSLAESYYGDSRESMIFLVSDFADKIPVLPVKDNVVYIPVGSSSNNTGVIGLTIQREEPGSKRFNLTLLIKNYSNGTASFPLVYLLNGKVFDSENIKIDPGQEKRILRQGVNWGTGLLKIELGLEDDLKLDNQVYALLSEPDKMPVLLVSTKNLWALEKALALHPEIDLTRITPEMAKKTKLTDYRLVIYDGEVPAEAQGLPHVSIMPLSEETVIPGLRGQSLSSIPPATPLLKGGSVSPLEKGGLMGILREKAPETDALQQPGRMNSGGRRDETLLVEGKTSQRSLKFPLTLPLSPGGRGRGEGGISVRDKFSHLNLSESIRSLQTDHASLSRLEWDPEHPLMKDLDWEGVVLAEISSLALREGLNRILWSDGKILMTVTESQGVKGLALGFNPVKGNFPFQPAFPVFWHNMMEWFRGENPLSSPFIKTDLSYSIPDYISGDKPALELLSTTGEKNDLPYRKGVEMSLELKKAGWYQLKGKSFFHLLAVNFLNEEESDIGPKYFPEPVKESFRGDLNPAVQKGRISFRKLFLVLGLVAMLMDWLGRGARLRSYRSYESVRQLSFRA